jgi:hypothetical protein
VRPHPVVAAEALAKQPAQVPLVEDAASAPPGPGAPPAATMPGDDGLGLDDPKTVLPAGPEAREPYKEDPVAGLDPQPGTRPGRARDDVELVPEGELASDCLGSPIRVRRDRDQGPRRAAAAAAARSG